MPTCFQGTNHERRVIVASANAGVRDQVLQRLSESKWSVESALGGADALAKLEDHAFDAFLVDRWLPDLDVNELIESIRSRHPEMQVDFIDETAQVEAEMTVAEETHSMPIEEAGEPIDPLPGMVGRSRAMSEVYRLARLVARHKATVLVTGPTGSGKELVAGGIHQISPRASKPFVVINCAAIPETLLESELFGYTKGAFTGATQSAIGRIHAAQGGTLFLDEIGELPLAMQAKLLRFLQNGEVQRLGSPDVFRLDVRVIAATNVDLKKKVAAGEFREDLYYRLSVFPLSIPALRERPEDIVTLARRFAEDMAGRSHSPAKEFSNDACEQLKKASWPGNVRQLQHAVERAFILADDQQYLTREHFADGLV